MPLIATPPRPSPLDEIGQAPLFLSRLVPDLRQAHVRRDLRDPYEMHRTLMRGFPLVGAADAGRAREAHGVLWRLDVRDDRLPTILLQSISRPDWTPLLADEWFCPIHRLPRGVDTPMQTKPLTAAPHPGQCLSFRLRANVVKRISRQNPTLGAAMAGKRVGVVGPEAQIAWLLRQAPRCGFEVAGAWIDPRTGESVAGQPDAAGHWPIADFRALAIPEPRDQTGNAPQYAPGRQRREERRAASFSAVRFEGVLRVVDPSLFARALAAGIGPGKAFGFGLLSVARPS